MNYYQKPVILTNYYSNNSQWETTSDKSSLFKHITNSNLKFGSDDGDNATATIEIDTGTTYQEIFGFGASLSE